MKFYFQLLVWIPMFLLMGSCKKISAEKNNPSAPSYIPTRAHIISPFFFIEKFRKPWMTDTEVIQSAIDNVPENSVLKFANKKYIISHTIIVNKSLHFRGPVILKRDDQYQYRLSTPASVNDKQVVLNSVDGLNAGDFCYLADGSKTDGGTTSLNMITGINGDTVSLYYATRTLLNGSSDFGVGTHFIKDVRFFWIRDKNDEVFPTQSCSFSRITFDGNRENNNISFSWRINTAVMALTLGPTEFDHCTFIHSPGETIVGHNCIITNSLFKDLNGSAFHTSMDRQKVSEDQIHSVLKNNYFENTNEVSTYIGGHSEGCITHSNSGGYYTATENSFVNVGEAVIATLYPSVSPNDWGTSNILFSNNIINTQGKLVRALATHVSGEVKNVRIIDNQIENAIFIDWSEAAIVWPDVICER